MFNYEGGDANLLFSFLGAKLLVVFKTIAGFFR